MSLDWGTIEFRSDPSTYQIEKNGVKTHTVRIVSTQMAKRLDSGAAIRISIRNTETGFCFTRELTNIYKEEDILGHCLYSFTWKHEEDQRNDI